jgi:hypothetical protein
VFFKGNLAEKHRPSYYNHRFRKAKIDCLSFVMSQLLVQPIIAFFSSFFAVAAYSTNEANKAGGMRR